MKSTRKLVLYLCFSIFYFGYAQVKTVPADAKMDQFVTALMQKMTLDEKIGQLNLVTPGGAVNGRGS